MIKELSVLSQRFNDFVNQCQTAKLSVFIFSQSVLRSRRVYRCLAVYSLAPDHFLDCSRVLEYAKIRTVLQSHPVLNG